MEKGESLKLAKSIAQSLNTEIEQNGNASLVLSGGQSPIQIFYHLNQINLEWSKVSIVLGDDRIVSKDHNDSNEKLVKNHLLINEAKKANYISLLHPRLSHDSLAFPFTVVLLGLGADGHFASLFSSLLEEKSLFDIDAKPEIYSSVGALGDPSFQRITMNLAMLTSTQRCILLVSSNAKRNIISQGKMNKDLPIYYLLNQSKVKIEFSDTDF